MPSLRAVLAGRGLLQEMESVVTRARMFRHKPDGDVTFMKLKDKNGVPVPVFQDPLHYPHGTKFLAPGRQSQSSIPYENTAC